MNTEILERALTPILESYMNIDFDFENKSLLIHNIETKERVAILKNMKIIIHSKDHNPPHFHVISNDKTIDAKFTIDTCELLSGTIKAKDIKKIEAFHKHPKTAIIMKIIWDKRKQ